MTQLVPENVTRKLDNLGRITLPKGLRDRMYLNDNTELEIFTANVDGRNCIVLATPETEASKLLLAQQLFQECDIKLPNEIIEYIDSVVNHYGEDSDN